MRSLVKHKIAFSVAGDCIAIIIALFLSMHLSFKKEELSSQLIMDNASGLILLLLPVLLILFFVRGYSNYHIQLRFRIMRQMLLIFLGLFLSAIFTTFTFFLFREAVPRTVLLLFYLFSPILMVVMRYLTNLMTPITTSNLLIIGPRERFKVIEDMTNSRRYLCSKVFGLLSENQLPENTTSHPNCADYSELIAVIDQRNIDHIVLATDLINTELTRLLVICAQKKIKISRFIQIIEDISGQIPIEYLDDHWFIFEFGSKNFHYFWYAKRLVDLSIAVVGIILVFPFLLLAAVFIKLDSPGPIFYSQIRTGRYNKLFRAWKLRTMIDGADNNNVHWTLKDDDRITRVGKWLRKMRFDEVPQLINILKGEMSLIGPRPEAISLVEKYTEAIPYYSERHMVSPGITGWAQINYPYGNSIEDSLQKLKFDFYYIKNRSVMLDAVIFFRTIRTVLTGKGAM